LYFFYFFWNSCNNFLSLCYIFHFIQNALPIFLCFLFDELSIWKSSSEDNGLIWPSSFIEVLNDLNLSSISWFFYALDLGSSLSSDFAFFGVLQYIWYIMTVTMANGYTSFCNQSRLELLLSSSSPNTFYFDLEATLSFVKELAKTNCWLSDFTIKLVSAVWIEKLLLFGNKLNAWRLFFIILPADCERRESANDWGEYVKTANLSLFSKLMYKT